MRIDFRLPTANPFVATKLLARCGMIFGAGIPEPIAAETHGCFPQAPEATDLRTSLVRVKQVCISVLRECALALNGRCLNALVPVSVVVHIGFGETS